METKIQIYNLEESNTEIINNYIDSIISNYQDLGINPCVSILSDKKYKSGRLIYIMYSSKCMKKCIINKKHDIDCQCNNILYEKFYIDQNLNISYLDNKNNNIPIYINDLCDIINKLYPIFYLSI
jgi:hypothetical protein